MKKIALGIFVAILGIFGGLLYLADHAIPEAHAQALPPQGALSGGYPASLSSLTMSGDIIPDADATRTLGATSRRWVFGYIRELKDAAGNSRVNLTGSAANNFMGAIPDGASAIGHKFGNNPTLSTSGAKIASFYSDNFSTERASIAAPTGHYSTANQDMTVGSWSAEQRTTGAVPEDTPLKGWLRMVGGGVKARFMYCDYGTAGTGGTTGVVGQIYNSSDSVAVCSCTLSTCTAIVGVCDCNTALSSVKTYQFRIASTTDCTVNPSDIACTVELAR